jgi:hypothetical protein
MLARIALRSYTANHITRSTLRQYTTHHMTKKTFNNFFKNRGINYNSEEMSQDELRSKMALYLINNKDKLHHNYPGVLFELQQYHGIRLRELENMREKIQRMIKKRKSEQDEFDIMIPLLLTYENGITSVINKHRRQVRKIDDVKYQNRLFWDCTITTKSSLFPEE